MTILLGLLVGAAIGGVLGRVLPIVPLKPKYAPGDKVARPARRGDHMRTARIISAAVLVIGALVLMSGCDDQGGIKQKPGAEAGLTIYTDSAHGVVCYSKDYYRETLSCLKVAP